MFEHLNSFSYVRRYHDRLCCDYFCTRGVTHRSAGAITLRSCHHHFLFHSPSEASTKVRYIYWSGVICFTSSSTQFLAFKLVRSPHHLHIALLQRRADAFSQGVFSPFHTEFTSTNRSGGVLLRGDAAFWIEGIYMKLLLILHHASLVYGCSHMLNTVF